MIFIYKSAFGEIFSEINFDINILGVVVRKSILFPGWR